MTLVLLRRSDAPSASEGSAVSVHELCSSNSLSQKTQQFLHWSVKTVEINSCNNACFYSMILGFIFELSLHQFNDFGLLGLLRDFGRFPCRP